MAYALLGAHGSVEIRRRERPERAVLGDVAVQGHAEHAASGAAEHRPPTATAAPTRMSRPPATTSAPAPPSTSTTTPPTAKTIPATTINPDTPPMTKVPVTCSPQRWRNIIAERFMAGNGPKSSKARTGTTRNVTSDQMSAPTSAAKWSAGHPGCAAN